MTALTIDSIVTTSLSEPIHIVSEDMFGAIAVNSYGYNYFEQHIDLLGLTNVRFPGGTLSEGGYVIDGRIRLDAGDISLETLQGDRANFGFDLTHPELISPLALDYDDENHLLRDDVATFSQALDLAVRRDVSLDLVIPVERYFTGADFTDADVRDLATEIAQSDISDFLGRLKDGAFNDGALPQSITFEIGNEAYANPIEYAVVAKAMISEITSQMEGSDIDYEIAFQMGRGSFEFNNLNKSGYFTPFFDGSGDPIEALSDLGFTPGTRVSHDDQQTGIDQMMIGILGDELEHIDALRHHTLGFNSDTGRSVDSPFHERSSILDEWLQEFETKGISRDEIDYYISAWSTNSADGNGLPYELAAAGNTVELFAHFMDIGVDRAALWGVVGAFRYKPDISSTTVTDRLSNFLSPQAMIVKMLSENVIDSAYLGSTEVGTTGVTTYTFESNDSFNIFVVAKQFSNGQLDLDLDLGFLGDLHSVSLQNLDVEPGNSHGPSRLTETRQEVVDGKVSLEFDQHDEIIMVEIEKGESESYLLVEAIEQLTGTPISLAAGFEVKRASDVGDTLSGTANTDVIVGGAGNDMLTGGGGHKSVFGNGMGSSDFARLGANNGDFIFGGDGDDTINGYAGNDLISGDAGNDDLWGGSGFDTFVFSSGDDTIHDFASGVDTIAVEADMLGGLPIELWLAEIGSVQDGHVVLEHPTNGSLTIKGIETVDDLFGDLAIIDATDHFAF